MARQKVEIQSPLAGLDRAWAVQSQPPFTLSDANNVRGRSPFDDRAILGSRPGLVKAFCQKVGGPVESSTIGFAMTANVLLYSCTPDSHYGSNSLLLLDHLSGCTSRTAARFNLVSLVGKTVTSAYLRMYWVKANNSSRVGKVRRLTELQWNATEVTWNRASVALDWTNGGPYTTTDEASWLGIDGGVFPQAFSVFGMGPLAKYAVDNDNGKLELLFMLDSETGSRSMHIHSNISATPPELVVTYEVAV
jgi:hypothetical protein